jgi:glutamate-1-semialdehyde 2,1-aminomutase
MTQEPSLFARALRSIPGGVNSPVRAFRSIGGEPFFTERADSCYLFTTEGQKLIDYVGTWGPAIHGHNHPRIRKAIQQALEKGTNFGTPNCYEIPMAELICSVVPSVEKVRMVNSGTEATMSCIRLARGFTNREKIIKFEGCYHGHSDAMLVKAGSGALTHGEPDSAGVTIGTSKDTLLLPFNNLERLREEFEKCGKEIAAIILEPFPANMGLILPDPDFLPELQKLAIRYGTLVIFDEVMTGFRIALGGVQKYVGITPDLTALGKIIGGGLPVGAFGGRREIMDLLAPLGPVYQAGTLSGNPMALAAGIEAISMLQENNPYSTLENRTRILADTIQLAFAHKGIAAQLPRFGSMLSIFFSDKRIRDFDDVMHSDKAIFKKLFHECLKRQLFLPPSPFETWFVSTAHTNAVIESSCEILSEAIKAI